MVFNPSNAATVYEPNSGKNIRWALIFSACGALMLVYGKHPGTIALGVLMLLGAAMHAVSAAKRVPRLFVNADGVRLKTLFHERWAHWSSLDAFQILRMRVSLLRTVQSASATIVGPHVDPCLGGGKFAIPDGFKTPLDDIIADLNGRLRRAQGVPDVAGSSGMRYGVEGARWPWLTYVILAVLIAVYSVEIAYGVTPGPSRSTPSLRTLVFFGGLNSYLVATGEWTRIFTAPLLHGNFGHILGNGIALLMAGHALERLIGRAWFLALFVVSAIGGSLMSLALNPNTIVSVGASGGIVGLFAAAMIASFRHPAGSSGRWSMQLASFRILIPALIPVFFAAAGQSHVDFAAHFGGAVAGALFGFIMLMSWYGDERLPGLRALAATIATLGALLCAGSFVITFVAYFGAAAAAAAH